MAIETEPTPPGVAQGPVKAGAPGLDPDMTVSDAFAMVVRSTLEHLQANERGMLSGRDPEYLHQMRVALRRMRSAFSVFSGALPREACAPHIAHIKWLALALGPARDWDVFVTETLPAIRSAFDRLPALTPFAREAARLQNAARRKARRAVRSDRYNRVLGELASWLASQGWREGAESERIALLDAPVHAYAVDELERRYQRVRKRGRKLEELSAGELHRLRIAIKKLRYAVDFFASLSSVEKVRPFRPCLTRLQTILGTMNDAVNIEHLLREAFGDTRDDVAEARGILLGWSAGRADALKADLGRAWKAFRRSETFW